MAMFIRVKRKKTTYFLHCDPSETVLEIKQKLQALSDNPVDCQRLILLSSQLVLEDSKTLADQKVENDAIVALCLKISDPRVHAIDTIMRHPVGLHFYEIPEPPPPKLPPVQEPILSENGLSLDPPPPVPPRVQRAMSTLLRVPYRPPVTEDLAKEAAQKEALRSGKSKKDDVLKDTSKNQSTEKEAVKQDLKEASTKPGAKKQGSSAKKIRGTRTEDSKKGKSNKSDTKGRKSKKEGEQDPIQKEQAEEVCVAPPDPGVWEDISIDKLTDYAALIDSD